MSGLMTARFETRREAELAIEHLVQQEGLPRESITVLPVGSRNSAGTRTSGSDRADAQPGSEDRNDAALEGEVEVSVHAPSDRTDSVRHALTEAGGQDVSAA